MRRTPLYDRHLAAGARLVDFHGWEMPVQYEGILEEGRRVRRSAGLFDLCHMGRLVVEGRDRERLVERVFSARLSSLRMGRAKYGFLLDASGFPIDDVLVYRAPERVHMVINATGRERDREWIESHRHREGFQATVEEVSDAQAMLALQGPASQAVLAKVCDLKLEDLRFYAFREGARVAGATTLVARTGYTGEDGFELFFDPTKAHEVWDALLEAGADFGLAPIGLGARDILRLEAGMPLYGQEIGSTIDPLEADLGFGVDLEKTDAIGIEPLRRRAAAAPGRRAVSLLSSGGPIARAGAPLICEGRARGVVTSGGRSPTLEKNIARALMDPSAASSPGSPVEVDIRGRLWPYEVVAGPFYKRSRS